jgi:tyrosyl-tRNA synthetase
VAAGKEHPLEVKKALARRIISDFHSVEAAKQAQQDFEAQFQKKSLPDVIDSSAAYQLSQPKELFRVLVELKVFPSNSECQRKIKEGSVYVDTGHLGPTNWTRLTNPTSKLHLDAGEDGSLALSIGEVRVPVQIATFKAGKKIFRVPFTT